MSDIAARIQSSAELHPAQKAALLPAVEAGEQALRSRGFPEEVIERMVSSMVTELVTPGSLASQLGEGQAMLDVLAEWDGSADLPADVRSTVEEMKEVSASMAQYYTLIESDPAGVLAAKARCFVTYLGVGGKPV